ncbi:hypothetical protein VTJ04DRAFT_6256 [Mycothermus thermophilus]|uniref:uncharacterized protein n=1 Tax=Humicola insolens TaxID=85995 RepID=UPI0037426333
MSSCLRGRRYRLVASASLIPILIRGLSPPPLVLFHFPRFFSANDAELTQHPFPFIHMDVDIIMIKTPT